MSRHSWALQRALHAALRADPAVAALSLGTIVDEPLAALPEAPVVVLGEETVRPFDSAGATGAEHRIEIALVGRAHGFAALKQLAAAVLPVVLGPLPLPGARVVNAAFLGARARRDAGRGLRRIDITFRLVVEDDAAQTGG